MPTVAYLSHHLGVVDDGGPESRQDNVFNAIEWYEFLHEVTPWVVVMPWYPSVVALREIFRPRAVAGQLVVLSRCDLLVLVGGVVSDHMRLEVKRAGAERIAVVDLTDLGRSPPRGDLATARAAILGLERAAHALVSDLD